MPKTCLILCIIVMCLAYVQSSYKPVKRGTLVYEEMAVSVNKFGIDLFKVIASSQPSSSSNFIFSPFTIFRILSMIMAGSRGKSFNQLLKTLHFVDPTNSLTNHEFNNNIDNNGTACFDEKHQDMIHQDIGLLTSQLLLDATSGGIKLDIFSGTYLDQNLLIDPAFKNILSNYYKSIITNLDFGKNPRQAENVINGDVAKATHNQITEIIPPKALDHKTRLVLSDALFFRGDWKEKFNRGDTIDINFYDDQGGVTQTSGMRALRRSIFGRSSILGDELVTKVLRLDYKNSRFAMFIILPPKGHLTELINKLNADSFEGILSNTFENKVNITIPKFEMEYASQMNSLLKQIGIRDIFGHKANLSGMTQNLQHILSGTNYTIKNKEELYVDKIFGKAKIIVDEEGSTASQSVSAVISAKSIPIIREFQANSPFILVIRDTHTGLILFMGVYNKPSKSILKNH